jgi:hypothetical protein
VHIRPLTDLPVLQCRDEEKGTFLAAMAALTEFIQDEIRYVPECASRASHQRDDGSH